MAKDKQKVPCPETKTVGIVSAGRHTGATHLTISLANMLCSVRGERVAVLEWNQHQDFRKIEEVCTSGLQKNGSFQVLGVDYYKEAGIKEWELCMNQSYGYVLVDYGAADEQVLYESGRCEQRIMLGSLSEWQQNAFLAQIAEAKRWKRGFTFAVIFGSKETKEEAEKKLRITLHQVSLSVDAFTVTLDDMMQLEKLL